MGVTAACIAYEAYHIHSIYEDYGPIAALTALGIDLALIYTGGIVLEAATPALRAAVIAALDKMPGMRIALGALAERLILATESLSGTKLGQGIAKVEAGLVKGYDKVRGVFERGAEAAASKPKKAVRFAEGVESEAATTIPLPQDRPPMSQQYSTAFRAKLEEGVHYPGHGDTIHFREANKQLYNALQSDKVFVEQMETLYPGITKAVSPGPKGGFPKEAPTRVDLTWHHNTYEPGVLELVPRVHHRAGGPVTQNLHPDGKGGQALWGKGRK